MHWLPFFEGQDTAPSPSQQYAEDWNLALGLETTTAPTASMNLSSNIGHRWSANHAADDARVHNGHAYKHPFNAYNGSDLHDGFTTHCGARPSKFVLPSASRFNVSGGLGFMSMSKPMPMPEPPSKIANFFSKLKAYIKAPFCRQKK
jgi:hypothetical protein